MNDRELLEFIAAQVGTLTSKVDVLGNEMTEVKALVKQNSNDIIRLEDKVDKNLSALYDGYKQNTEAIKALSGKVDALTEKIDRNDIEIQVIKGGKRA